MPSSQCSRARIQAPAKIHASYLVIMSHYCPQFETKSPLPLVLHDTESSLESRSAVLQNIAHSGLFSLLEFSGGQTFMARLARSWGWVPSISWLEGAYDEKSSHERWRHRCSVLSVSPLTGRAGASFYGGRFYPHSSTVRVCLTLHCGIAHKVALLFSILYYI